MHSIARDGTVLCFFACSGSLSSMLQLSWRAVNSEHPISQTQLVVYPNTMLSHINVGETLVNEVVLLPTYSPFSTLCRVSAMNWSGS